MAYPSGPTSSQPPSRFHELLRQLAWVHDRETSELRSALEVANQSGLSLCVSATHHMQARVFDCEASPAVERRVSENVEHTMLHQPPSFITTSSAQRLNDPDVEEVALAPIDENGMIAHPPVDDPSRLQVTSVIPSSPSKLRPKGLELRAWSEEGLSSAPSRLTSSPSLPSLDGVGAGAEHAGVENTSTLQTKGCLLKGASASVSNLPTETHRNRAPANLKSKSELSSFRAGHNQTLIEEEEGIQNSWLAGMVAKGLAWSDWISSLHEPDHTGCAAALLLNERFATLCGTVILLHASYMTYQSNVSMAEYAENKSRGLANMVIELAFLSFYTFEVVLKLYVHRVFFFISKDKAWNVFDLVLVLQGVIDELVQWAIDEGESGNATVLRLVRLLKLGKVLRTLRAVTFFKELRVMIQSIAGSIVALFWSFVMICLLLFIFSLLFVQLVSSHLSLNHESMSDRQVKNAVLYFGSVQLAGLSLYKCTSGGLDWQHIYNVLENTGFISAALFIFFLVFFNFSVMNIVIGVMLEQVNSYNLPSREAQMIDRARQHDDLCAELEAVLHELDLDESGTLSWEEFQGTAMQGDVKIYLEMLGIELKDAQLFFKVLEEAQGSHDLMIDDIVRFCTKMKGVATGIDMQCLAFQVKTLQLSLDEIATALGDKEPSKTRKTRIQARKTFRSRTRSKMPRAFSKASRVPSLETTY